MTVGPNSDINGNGVQDSNPADVLAKAELERAELLSQMDEERKNLAIAILQMLTALKSGNVGEALNVAMASVLPCAMGVEGDQVGLSGATENVASGVRSYITEIQNFFNEGKTMTPDDAQKMIDATSAFAAMLHKEKDSGNSPLDSNTIDQLLTSLGTFGSTLLETPPKPGVQGSDPTPPKWDTNGPLPAKKDDVALLMQTWFRGSPEPQPPSGGSPSPIPNTPQFPAEVTTETNALQAMTGNIGSLSSSATSFEQYYTNLLNQLQGAYSTIQQSMNAQNNMIVSNIRSAGG